MPVAYFAFPPSADVSVTATAPAAPVQTGGTFSYSVMVANSGPDDASSVAVSIPAHASVRFSALQQPAGWSCTTPAAGATGAVSCTAAALTAGASATFVVTASRGLRRRERDAHRAERVGEQHDVRSGGGEQPGVGHDHRCQSAAGDQRRHRARRGVAGPRGVQGRAPS